MAEVTGSLKHDLSVMRMKQLLYNHFPITVVQL
jgi:hypothetical protein